jgi:hypothetical protein
MILSAHCTAAATLASVRALERFIKQILSGLQVTTERGRHPFRCTFHMRRSPSLRPNTNKSHPMRSIENVRILDATVNVEQSVLTYDLGKFLRKRLSVRWEETKKHLRSGIYYSITCNSTREGLSALSRNIRDCDFGFRMPPRRDMDGRSLAAVFHVD